MRGLGDAILCAREFVDGEPFGVILGDDIVYTGNGEPALKQLMDRYYETGSTVVGCQEVPEDKVSSYGIIRGEKTENLDLLMVVDMIEKPSIKEAPGRFAALGRYVIIPEVFDILEQTKPGKRYDTGNKLGYLKAVVEFALRREDLGGKISRVFEISFTVIVETAEFK